MIHLTLIDFIDALLEVLEIAATIMLVATVILLHRRIKWLEQRHDYLLQLVRRHKLDKNVTK